jgi:1,4-alpha-glucan branching enzyme
MSEPQASESTGGGQPRASRSAVGTDPIGPELERLAAGAHSDPHAVLGPHREGDGWVVRAWLPDAQSARLVVDGAGPLDMAVKHQAGVFEANVTSPDVPSYRVEATWPDGERSLEDDPYRFWPTLGDIDLHLIGEGRHERLWHALGAHPRTHQGTAGTAFAVWAPSARAVRVVGDCNHWDGRRHPMRALGASGVWEVFLPGVGPGSRYKFEVLGADGRLRLKADPLATATEVPPATASVVTDARHQWADGEWMERRAAATPWTEPVSIYELHIGSWRYTEDTDGTWRPMTYRELAETLPAYIREMGFTHVELLPVAEHPYGPSWGYQVSAYYAPTARYGSPDDCRALVDALHRAGIGVIVDWVPAHFPRDDFALARFDGTALYEHADPRQGEHPDWGTLVFNFGRHEVRNFLIANALYWLEEFHIDGLRVDAVASMLYLDYSREAGEWVPNEFGGRENLDAIAFLRELNEVVHREHAGVMMVAEESTAWPGVSRPAHLGGLGFGFKWNMGWMHDTLAYFSHEPIHRRYHHHALTFGLLYAFHENFMLPLSHDEVVHGKGSLLQKMPGDRWQQLANLRALYGWMWAHPGKQLLFMGGELAQEREWSESRSLDWHLLEWDGHRGMQHLLLALNWTYRSEPALWERDFSDEGFDWLTADDGDNSVYAFVRYSADRTRSFVCVANLTPVPRPSHWVNLPPGRWEVVITTDDRAFGGSGWGPHSGAIVDGPCLDVPPLSVVWLRPA